MHSRFLSLLAVACLLFSTVIESRGPRCLHCHPVDSPSECDWVVQCWPQGVCFADHFINTDGSHKYTFGCRSSEECNNGSHPVKRDNKSLCDSCCTGDLCNANLGSQNGTTPPPGQPCLTCEGVSSTTHCHRLTYCPAGETCYAQNSVTHVDSFNMGCMMKQACEGFSGEAIGKRSANITNEDSALCHECCEGPVCNYGACVIQPITTTKQHHVHVSHTKHQHVGHSTKQAHVDQTTPPLPTHRDCWDVKTAERNSTTGWYRVLLSGHQAVSVFCDMNTAGGGWTVFQRRADGSVSFKQNYNTYEKGFCNEQEFWLGNANLHSFTQRDQAMMLRVDLCDWDGNNTYAEYGTFSVGPPSDDYRLNVTEYSGTAGDALITGRDNVTANGQEFSTPNADHDIVGGNCADIYHSGWWFSDCYTANLNNPYLRGHSEAQRGVEWETWLYAYSLKTTEMKFRPASAEPSDDEPFICP